MPERTCQGCPAVFTPSVNEHRKRLWCSDACRTRASYVTRKAEGLVYFPTSYVRVAACARCDQLTVFRTARGRICVGCRKAHAAEVERQRYRRVAEQVTTRLRAYRAELTEEQKAAVKATRRAWLERVGGRAESTKASDERRRALKLGLEAENFTRIEIFERDNWTCGLCSDPIDRSLNFPHPGSVSLDHVVPLSKGGPHTRRNVQAAHLSCNLLKADSILEEVS